MHAHAEFASAYREQAPRAVAIASSVLRDPAEAEDVVHDIFTQLWLRPEAFDPARASLSTYVGMLARSRAIDRRRALAARAEAGRRAAAEAERSECHERSPAQVLTDRERSTRLAGALECLPSTQREAVLAFAHGISPRELACTRGLSLGTAKSRVRLGLNRARLAVRTAP